MCVQWNYFSSIKFWRSTKSLLLSLIIIALIIEENPITIILLITSMKMANCKKKINFTQINYLSIIWSTDFEHPQ
jgi:hypothetical protein